MLGLISTLTLLTGLLTACGGRFEADSSTSAQVRPPVTSDPLTSEEQRRWEWGQDSEFMRAQVLETDRGRESFLQDLMEEKRSYTDDQLAFEAEAQFQKNEKKRTESDKIKFCEDLNVTSANGELDLSELYNEEEALPTSMPSKDLENSSSLEKKNKFVCILLPIAIRMNEEVFRQRLEVIRLAGKKKQGTTLMTEDQKWLDNMKIAYNLKVENSDADLLRRVDIIPLPLLLAQAALESGWGTSRAAGQLKNLFGMHAAVGQPCEKGKGGAGACVRKFKTLAEGVSAYIRLLNVGTYYEKFRESRNKMRVANDPLNSLKLLEALGGYNETPKKYIQDVRELMIKHNKLTQFVFSEDEVGD